MTIFTFRITVTRLATGRIGNIPVILIAFITVVTNNVLETFLAPLPCGTVLTSVTQFPIEAVSTVALASCLVTLVVVGTCQEK